MKPNVQKILDVMSNQDVTFFIPPYQRNYEWTTEQCKVFLADIIKTAENNKNGKITEHFFGSITYFVNPKIFLQPDKLILIDGQQRITTTMLFLIALRDIIDDENSKKYINDHYLKNNNADDSTAYKIKLKQVETDWEVYKHIVMEEKISLSERSASVYKNYMYFKSNLTELQNQTNLLDLISYGLNSFSVVTLQLEPEQNSWENPQEIFESMNSIGKPLALSDLVRNYLLLGLDSETQNQFYHDYWLKIEKTVPGYVSNFIRDYMQCMKGRPFKQAKESNYKELYADFKEIFADKNSKYLLSKMSEYCDYYAIIALNKSTGNMKLDKLIDDIKFVNATTSYSFLMAILAEWKNGMLTTYDLIDIFQVFKIYMLRRRLIGLAGTENQNFPFFTKKIENLIVAKDKKEAMFELLTDAENKMRLPNDSEMFHELSTMNFYNFKYCKFILALLEESITKSRPDMDDVSLQIEHIMPQTLTKEWISDLGPDYERIHQENLNTIGNLTLIRHNQILSNHSFSTKKQVYEHNSGLQIAKTMITDKDIWDENSIKMRGAWMIKYLLENVLTIPNTMRKTNNFVPKIGKHLSFLELQLIGKEISFIPNPSIRVKIIGDRTVEFEGSPWKLSPLTCEIFKRMGASYKAKTFQGAQYWEYDGIKLADIL